jgi:hypothetical protein
MYLTLLILYNIILLVILESMFLLSYNTYSLYVIGLYNYSYNTVFLMLYYIIVFVNNTQGYDFFFIAGRKTKKASNKVTPAADKEPALITVPAGATVAAAAAAAAKEPALKTVPASTGDDPSNPLHIESTDVPKKTSELLNDASQGDALLTIEGAEVSPATQSDLGNVRADIEESMDNGKKPFNLLDGTKPSEALETIKGVFGDLSSVYFPLQAPSSSDITTIQEYIASTFQGKAEDFKEFREELNRYHLALTSPEKLCNKIPEQSKALFADVIYVCKRIYGEPGTVSFPLVEVEREAVVYLDGIIKKKKSGSDPDEERLLFYYRHLHDIAFSSDDKQAYTPLGGSAASFSRMAQGNGDGNNGLDADAAGNGMTNLQPSTQPQVSSVLPSQLPRSQSQDHRKDDSTLDSGAAGNGKAKQGPHTTSGKGLGRQRSVLQESKELPLPVKKSRTADRVENIDIGSRSRKRKAVDDIDEVESKVFDPAACKIVGPCREYALVSSHIDKDGSRYTSDIIAWGSFLSCFGKRR